MIWFADVLVVYRARTRELRVEKAISDGRTLRGKIAPMLAENGVFLDRVTAGGSGIRGIVFISLRTGPWLAS